MGAKPLVDGGKSSRIFYVEHQTSEFLNVPRLIYFHPKSKTYYTIWVIAKKAAYNP
jgi:hypothetical protein